MVDALVGNWKFETSENFEEFLKELNVGFMQRKVAVAAKPSLEITKDGDWWNIKSVSIKTTENKFKIGEEFEEVKADGSKGKSTFTIDGDKLLQTSDNNGKEYHTTREIDNGKLKITVKAGNVVCVRTYTRV